MTAANDGRVDELANAAIDGELDADAQEELARLLDEEKGLIPRFQEMLLLEGALRARAPTCAHAERRSGRHCTTDHAATTGAGACTGGRDVECALPALQCASA